jgi:hypothetical protein
VYPPCPGCLGSPGGFGIFESSDRLAEVDKSLSDSESKEVDESKGIGVQERECLREPLFGYGEKR